MACIYMSYTCCCQQVLKGAADKHTEFVAGQLPAGITEAYLFHKRMWHAKHPTQSQPQGKQGRGQYGRGWMSHDIYPAPVTVDHTCNRGGIACADSLRMQLCLQLEQLILQIQQ